MSGNGSRLVRPGRFGARAVPAVALAVGVLAASAGTSVGLEVTPVLPDLAARAAARPGLAEYQDSSGSRLLLRFDGYVYNRGTGALELRGSSPVAGEMSQVTQRVYDTGGGYADRANSPAPRVLFEPTDGHDHWHLRGAARYSLWNGGKSAEVGPSQKVGFCLIDSTRTDTWAPTTAHYTNSSTGFCGHGKPNAQTVTMGVSAGWRDFYDRSLPFQWVDVSDVQPGNYSIRSDVDPDGVIAESAEQNAPVFTDFVLPGYVAKPVSKSVSGLTSSTVTLQADQFGSPTAGRQFRIEEGPNRGTVSPGSGTWFSGSSVTYTPERGYTGKVTFTYSARETGKLFPREPHKATVTLTVGTLGWPLALGGMQSQQVAGTANQFTVAGADDVEWTVDGIRGGSGEAGMISDGGWYVAPDVVPETGRAVRIRATAPSGDFQETVVRVIRPAESRRAPDVPGAVPRPDGGVLARPQVGFDHGDLVVRTVAWRAGVLHMSVVGTSHSCRATVSAGQPITCLLATGLRSADIRGEQVVATLRSGGKVLGSRAVAVP